jgi:hypothetical protein
MAARRAAARPPNERLRALIEEAGCSNVGLARLVNRDGAERGLDLRYDKTSVTRWLRGQQPRGTAPLVIAAVLSRELGREVSVQDIGMARGRGPEVSETGLLFAPTPAEARERAIELWRGDAEGRTAQNGTRLSVAALLGPSRDWLIAARDPDPAHAGAPPVDAADVELVDAATRHIADLDHRFGGGHVRPLAVQYLAGTVTELLKGGYDGAVGRQLYAAAARLTELAGYTAYDCGRPGLAQRHYIQALRLSQAAHDRGYGGYVLAAGMSHLAAALGHPREVAQLARAAQEGARGRTGPELQACLHAAEARGHALLGDARACNQAAGRAVEALARPGSGEPPHWIAHFDRARLAGELAHCHLDLRQPGSAARRAEEALAGTPEHRPRRRAVNLLLLATAQVQTGEVERGCATARQAVALLFRLRSALATAHLNAFRARLRDFPGVPAVRDFEDRLHDAAGRSVLARPAGPVPGG